MMKPAVPDATGDENAGTGDATNGTEVVPVPDATSSCQSCPSFDDNGGSLHQDGIPTIPHEVYYDAATK
jgi:hypothetical protein